MQDLPRLHAADDVLSADATIPMTPAQAHYLAHVLRRGPGDAVRLFNARDGEWQAAIEQLRRDRGSFRVLAPLRPAAPEPGPVLAFAPLRRDATDLVVRMATELGVSRLAPVLTERGQVSRVNLERWHAIAVEAAEQCERLTVPSVDAPVRLPDLLGAWPAGRPLLAALERSDGTAARLSAWRSADDAASPPGLLIGPEGGFSPAERGMLLGRPFVVAVSLGARILRAETAAVSALATLQA